MKIRLLSHLIEEKIPAYGNHLAHVEIKQKKSIKRGDSCNTFRFSLENHWGTHIDAPAHFFSNGKKIYDYPCDYWIFNQPCVVKVDLDKGIDIGPGQLKEKIPVESDLLLIKTGFGRFRKEKKYSLCGPAIKPETADWLRRGRPKLRVIGFDFVSVGSFAFRSQARQAHRAFLGTGQNKPILIIEDMDLSANLSGLDKVFVAPFLIKGLDSANCTVFGFFKSKNRKVKK